MPTVTLNKEVFEKLVGKKLPLDKLKDRISMLGTDLEYIEGNNIHVEIFPNRPDMLSEQGFSRAFSSFIGVKTGLRKYDVKKSGQKVVIDKSVTMRAYTACAIVKNIKLTDERIREIMQIQEKLAATHGRNRKKSAYGLYPTGGINFPVKYIAMDPKKVKFKPLGFPKEVCAADIEELHPKGREYKHVAKGWTKYPFFVDAKDNIMCMLPYTNSQDTGKIDETTTEVFIECTGTDLANVNIALNIFVTMLADMGGDIYSMEMVYPDKTITTPNLSPRKVKLDIARCNKLLGLDLKEKDVKQLLEKMGYGYEKGNALVPAYRADVLHQVDLMEDIAIAYGYENFDPLIPNISTVGEESKEEGFVRKVSELLVGLGLLEINSYHLTNSNDLTLKMGIEYPPVALQNALNEDYDVLRNWMLPSLMKVFSENKHYEYPQQVFEVGTVFKHNTKFETHVEEFKRLAVASIGADVDFTHIRQLLDVLMSALDLKYKVRDEDHGSFIPGRVGRVSVETSDGKNVDVAYIGELSPQVLDNWELDYPVAGFELNITELFNVLLEENKL